MQILDGVSCNFSTRLFKTKVEKRSLKLKKQADSVKSDRLNAWTNAKLRVCRSDMEREDVEKSIVQLIPHKRTEILRRLVVPVGGHGRVTLSNV